MVTAEFIKIVLHHRLCYHHPMTIIQKSMAGVFLLLLLSACTRDRPAPETILEPPTQLAPAVGDGESGASTDIEVPESADTSTDSQDGDEQSATIVVTAPPPAEAAVEQQATAVVVVPPITVTAGQPVNETIQYTVSSGDTLYSIAENFGVTADTLRQLNYLQGDSIQANQVLRVPLLEGYTAEGRPTPTPEPLFHVVTAGETLYGIAVQYGIEPTSIIAANNIADQNGIFVGQSLRIPGYSASPGSGPVQLQPTQETIIIDAGNSTGSPAVTTSGTPVPSNSARVVHVVQSGEGLYAIAETYGVSAADIAAANNIQNYELLRVGQQLFIPGVVLDPGVVTTGGQRTHVVGAGESLLQIAVDYGVSAESIAATNNIANYDIIYPGQTLIIPAQ